MANGSDTFCFSVPKNKSDNTLRLYMQAVKDGRRAVATRLLDAPKKVLTTAANKKFRPDAFLRECKVRAMEPALLVARLCGHMEAQLATSNKLSRRPKKKIYPQPSKFSKSNGTGFAGHSSETIMLSAQILSVRSQRAKQERILAQMVGTMNKFLERCFVDPASWALFGALQKYLLPLLQKLLRNMSWRDIIDSDILCTGILDLLSSWTSTSHASNMTMLTLLLLDPLVELEEEELNFEVTTKLGDCVLVTLLAAIDDQAQQFYRLKHLHEKDSLITSRVPKKNTARLSSCAKRVERPSKKELKLKELADSLHALRLRIGELVRIAPAKQLWNAIKIRYCGRKTLALVKDAKDLTLQNLKVVGAEDECNDEKYGKALGALRVSCADIADRHRLFRQASYSTGNGVSVQVITNSAGAHSLQLFSYGDGSRISDDPLPMIAARRVQTELSTLATALPLTWGSSIFVCFDETNMGVLKVAIIGPSNTPYKNGIFVFDVKISPQYPTVPPRVMLRTTGHDTVRFNPNLYKDGRVCLSLLGTWSGPGWDASYSTLLQLLLSIQSLIFVEQPYFNEPGYDTCRDNPSVKNLSAQYDMTIRYRTLQWAILDQIKNPPLGFEKVAATHFNLKAKEIGEQLVEWEALDPRISAFASETRKKLGIPEPKANSRANRSKRPGPPSDRPKKILKVSK